MEFRFRGENFGVCKGFFAVSTIPDMFSNYEGGIIDMIKICEPILIYLENGLMSIFNSYGNSERERRNNKGWKTASWKQESDLCQDLTAQRNWGRKREMDRSVLRSSFGPFVP